MKLTLFLFAGSALLVVLVVLTYWQVGAGTFDMARVVAGTRSRRPSRSGCSCSRSSASARSIPDLCRSTRGRPTATSPRRRRFRCILAGVLLKIGAYGLIRLGLTLFPSGWADWALLICPHRRDQHRLRRALRDEPDRPEVRHRLLERQPHGLRPARARSGHALRAVGRGLPDVRARHHDGAVLRAHRLRLRADAHTPDRRDLRAHATCSARRGVLRHRGGVEHGPALRPPVSSPSCSSTWACR